MSWLYSRVLVEDYLLQNNSDLQLSAQLKSITTVNLFWSPGKQTDCCPSFQFGMMCAPLTVGNGAVLLSWFLAGFRAKTFQNVEAVKDLTEKEVGFGLNLSELFQKSNQLSCLSKTAHCLQSEDLIRSFRTLPQSGTMQNGIVFQREKLAHRTKEKESGFSLLTLTVEDASRIGKKEKWEIYKRTKKTTHARLRNQVANFCGDGYLSVELAEWMMGFPEGWSGLQPVEMDKFHMWQKRHGTSCAKEPPPEH